MIKLSKYIANRSSLVLGRPIGLLCFIVIGIIASSVLLKPSLYSNTSTLKSLLANQENVIHGVASVQQEQKLLNAWGNVPLYFEQHYLGDDINRESRQFLARGSQYTLRIAKDKITLLSQYVEKPPVEIRFLNAKASPLEGAEQLEAKVNYLKGEHPEHWETGISIYAAVQQKQIYPGVDVHYYGKQGQLEYDFIVAPETDFSQIQLSFEGVDSLELDAQGNLLLKTAQGVLQQNKPHLYQQIGDKRHVIEGQYRLLTDNRVGFQVGQYDRQYALVIDPVLVYSSFLGGENSDSGIAIAVDEQGSAYVLGQTRSTSLITENGYQEQLSGKTDLFIAKFAPEGNALEYATYLGGSDHDYPRDLVIDKDGFVYIVGMTRSNNFPVQNAMQATHNGGIYDTFITKLSPEGSQLEFSTYLGGGKIEQGNSIALDADNNIYITGTTRSSDFPTINAFQSTLAGNYDAYITKISNDGSQLVYSTFIGGTSREISRAIAVDSRGHATITGYTASRLDFPLQNEIQPTNSGRYDAFITQLTADGQALHYSSYLGGRGTDGGLGIAIDSQDNAVIVGVSRKGRRRGASPQDYPLKNAMQTTRSGRNNGVVSKFSADGLLLFSTYLGGNRSDDLRDVAIDDDDNILVIGSTSSKTGIPIVDPIQAELNKNRTDVYLAKLSSDGSEILFGSYFGGKHSESGLGIAVNDQDIYIVGNTNSRTDFPLQNAYQSSLGGKTDLFIAKIGPDNYLPQITSEAITSATVNQFYTYPVEAHDADVNDELEYSLTTAPAGMTIDSDSGLITWFANIVGDVEVDVTVTDGTAYATQSFTLNVEYEAQGLNIISTAIIKAAIGFPYNYDVNTDHDSADVKFELEIAPVGMIIDEYSGEITWMPTSEGNFPVSIRVEDGEGGIDNQSFRVNVVELDTSPLTITFTSSNAQGGFITNIVEQTVTGFLSRSDATLEVDGKAITIADDNSFSFDVTLRDVSGNLDDRANIFKISYSYRDDDFDWFSMGEQYLHMTLDRVSPSIIINSPQQDLITQVSLQTISGRLSETAELTIKGLPVVLAADNSFEFEISLTEGSNAIVLAATDNAGNVTMKTLALLLDTTAPMITVNSVQNGLITRTPIQSITGTLNEAATFSINGVPVTVTSDHSFNFAISLAQGSNVVELESTDIIGNTSTKTLILTLDTIAPTMTISSHQDGLVTQQAGQILAGNIGEVASLTINGSAVAVAGDNSFNQSIVLNEGDNLFTFIVTDTAGNETSSLLTLTLDTSAPVITVTSPQNNQTTELPQQIITGNLSETASLLINGEAVTVAQDNSFQYQVVLVEGINAYSLVATDALGNENTQTLTLTLDSGGMLIISITSPNDGTVTNQVSQNITGSLNLAGTLTINGEAVTIEVDNSFNHAAILNEGSNSFTIEGVVSGGDVVAKTITIILDTIAPDISISSPIDGETTTQSQQSIKGSLSEVASLTINGADVPLNGITKILNLGTVTENTNEGLSVVLDRNSGRYNVAGQVVVGSDNSFNIAMPLSQGENTFVITATDQAGNTTTKTLTINK